MNFKVNMINDLSKLNKKTIISKNQKVSQMNVTSYYPKSKILNTKCAYK